MTVTLIGAGCGVQTMTAQARDAVRQADLLIGAQRLLETCGDAVCEKVNEVRAEAVVSVLLERQPERACVLLSGDSGFYSGAARLVTLCSEKGMETDVMPGVSSLQFLAAKLGRPWQNWRLCSAHGTACDPVWEVMQGAPVFFLTGSETGPAQLCGELAQAGLGDLDITVGAGFGTPEEKILSAPAERIAQMTFAPLNVILSEPAPVWEKRVPGIADDAFLREKVPMTKQEVRAAALAQLAVTPRDICWDIGAGTGSVSVELALQAKAVWAVECDGDAFALAKRNREKFGAWNLRLVFGEAPEALEAFPKPDAVFIGGSGGRIGEILTHVRKTAPQARVCVTAVTPETLYLSVRAMEELGWRTQITQIAVTKTKTAGGLHLFAAQNPVFLITGAAE